MRFKISANRTYFVRSDGNDGDTGLADAPGGAFLTVQKAVDVVYGTLDLGGFDVDIQVRDGTFGRAVVPFPQVGKGNITLRGNATTPANVTLTAALVTAVSGVVDAQNNAALAVRDLTLTGTGSGQCLFAGLGGSINFTNVRFGTFTGGGHMLASQGGQITATGNYSIVGAAALHWWANDRGSIRVQSRTVTITGTPAFSAAFCQADYCGVATVNGNTYVGSATGIRFNAANNGVVVAFASLTEFPGSVAGTVQAGGIHPLLVDYATNAEIWAATPKMVVTADNIETASGFQGMADAATIAFDWDAGIVRFVSIAGNRALGNPSNNQVGTWRTIWVVGNDATPRTLTFSGNLVGNNAPIVVTNTSRILLFIFALDPTFAWVAPPSAPF